MTSAFDVQALLDKARKLGCSEAEVYEVQARATPANFENNRLKSIDTAETAAVAVRVVKEGKLGFANSSRPGDTEVVDLAARSAQFGPEADLSFAPPRPVRDDLQGYDPAVAAWTLEDMLARGEELVGSLKSLADGVLAGVTAEKQVMRKRLATSAGQDVREEGTAAAVVASVHLVEAENMILLFDFAASRRLDLDLERLRRRLAWAFAHARRNVPFRGGSYPVLFSPVAAMDLITPVVACLSGRAVAKGESPWKGRLGEKLFAADFTLVDDPTLPWGLQTTPFDDEGVPTRRRTVIEEGVLREFNLDLRSARALGTETTGNGFRSGPQSPPAPSPSNLVLEPGDTPWEDLVAGIKEGLYVGRLMGAWAGNPYSGQVAGNVDVGFRIENGEITGRVKDCMVSVDTFTAFRDHLLALSRETEITPNLSLLPYVLLDGVSVSAKA